MGSFFEKFLGTHWRTTLAGYCTIIGALADALAKLLQGQHVDGTQTLVLLGGGIGLIKAADAKKITPPATGEPKK